MLIITTQPFAIIRGKMPDGQYVVKTKNGKMFLSKRPVFTKPPTAKQLAARQLFAERSKSGAFRKHSGADREGESSK